MQGENQINSGVNKADVNKVTSTAPSIENEPTKPSQTTSPNNGGPAKPQAGIP